MSRLHFPHCLCRHSYLLEPLTCLLAAGCAAINPPVPAHKPAKGRDDSDLVTYACAQT